MITLRSTIVVFIIQILTGLNSSAKADLSFLDAKIKGDSCAKKVDFECALVWYQQAFDVPKSDEEKAQLNLSLAKAFYHKANFDSSYQLYNAARIGAEENDLDSLRGTALRGMAMILWRSGDNIRSMNYIIESIEIFRKLNLIPDLLNSTSVLGKVYISLEKYEDAEKMYQDVLRMSIEIKDSIEIATMYEYLGIIASSQKHFEKAISLYNRSLEMNKKLNRQLESAINYANIAETLNGLNRHSEALLHLKQAEIALESFGFLSALIFVKYELGTTYAALGEYKKSLDYYLVSLDLMDETGETREKQLVYELISKNYELQGNYKKAFEYYLQHTVAKDSLFTALKNSQIEEIKTKYETEKQEQQNYFLEREVNDKKSIIRIQYIAGTLMLVLLAVAAFLSLKLYRNRQLLMQVNKTKDKMFGFVAHDLINSSSVIKSLSELVTPAANINVTEAERSKLLKELQSASVSQSMLLDDLLAWSITQQSGYNFKPRPVSVDEYTDPLQKLFDFTIKNKKLNLYLNLKSEPKVFIDPKALFTILRNLTSNAIKFTPEGGSIGLSIEESEGQVLLKVSDNGVGMSQDCINQIKTGDGFKSTDGTASEKGSGLGLNLVKEFVKESGGRLDIKSEKNKGSTFLVYLPKG